KSCPIGLMPFNLAAYTKAKKFDIVKKYNAFDCIECGCCSYVCPAKIDIVGWIRYAKNYIKATQNKNNGK
ncbi:MAG TPA: electron transport complex subunit RsxC, partial [Exilispira sp.]|nr:electron transport complex subunit RsxC [Exilispira sp.]